MTLNAVYRFVRAHGDYCQFWTISIVDSCDSKGKVDVVGARGWGEETSITNIFIGIFIPTFRTWDSN